MGMNPGTVGILNVGAGDTKLTFDNTDPAETIRAARIVKDMLRRGYALLVEVERDGVKKFERALDFDENTCEYIIADYDPLAAKKAAAKEEALHGLPSGRGDTPAAPGGGEDPTQGAQAAVETPTESPPPRRGRARSRLDAGKTRAVAVAHSAGG